MDDLINDFNLVDWEKDEQGMLIKVYNEGRYEELLEHYCHEGVDVRHLNLEPDEYGFPIMPPLWEHDYSEDKNWFVSKGNFRPFEVYICSQSVVADTVEQGMKFLADYILKEIKKGVLGC